MEGYCSWLPVIGIDRTRRKASLSRGPWNKPQRQAPGREDLCRESPLTGAERNGPVNCMTHSLKEDNASKNPCLLLTDALKIRDVFFFSPQFFSFSSTFAL